MMHTSATRPASGLWATLVNLTVSGRLPLFVALLLILSWVRWHVEEGEGSGVKQLAAQVAQLKAAEVDLHAMHEHDLALAAAEDSNVVAPGSPVIGKASPRARLPAKTSYRCLLVGDSLTVGYGWNATGGDHPYHLHLSQLLEERHPRLDFHFDVEAEGGECVISACTRKSLLARVSERLTTPEPPEHPTDPPRPPPYYDLAIIMAGTNDLFHDFAAEDVRHGLERLHTLIWDQKLPVAPSPDGSARPDVSPVLQAKTIALTIPQWGDNDSWRPPRRPSKLAPALMASARPTVNAALKDFCATRHQEQCTFIDLDEWFPRWTLRPRELASKWQEAVHPTHEGYDEIALIVYQHLKNILPLN